MRKLNILRHIIDALWIVSMVSVAMLLFFIPMLFFVDDLGIDFKVNGIELVVTSLDSKVFFVINGMLYLCYIYALFLFKKIIREFLKSNIFSDKIIELFNKIGGVLVFIGLGLIISMLIYQLYCEGKLEIEISLGNNAVTLCMGLFFMVLTEVFKISKNLKRENDLTI